MAVTAPNSVIREAQEFEEDCLIISSNQDEILRLTEIVLRHFGLCNYFGESASVGIAQKNLEKTVKKLFSSQVPKLLARETCPSTLCPDRTVVQSLRVVVNFIEDLSRCYENLRKKGQDTTHIDSKILLIEFAAQRQRKRHQLPFKDVEEADKLLFDDILALMRGSYEYFGFDHPQLSEAVVNVNSVIATVMVDHFCRPEQVCILIKRLLTSQLPEDGLSHSSIDEDSIIALNPEIERLLHALIRIPSLGVRGIKTILYNQTSQNIDIITHAILQNITSTTHSEKLQAFYLLRNFLYVNTGENPQLSIPLAVKEEVDEEFIKTTLHSIRDLTAKKIKQIPVLGPLILNLPVVNNFIDGLQECLSLLINNPLLFKLLAHDLLQASTEHLALKILQQTTKAKIDDDDFVCVTSQEELGSIIERWKRPLYSNNEEINFSKKYLKWIVFTKKFLSKLVKEYALPPGKNITKPLIHKLISKLNDISEIYINDFLSLLTSAESRMMNSNEELLLSNLISSAALFFERYAKQLLIEKNKISIGSLPEGNFAARTIDEGQFFSAFVSSEPKLPFFNQEMLEKHLYKEIKKLIMIFFERIHSKNYTSLSAKYFSKMLANLALNILDKAVNPALFLVLFYELINGNITLTTGQASKLRSAQVKPLDPSLLESLDHIIKSFLAISSGSANSNLYNAVLRFVDSWKKRAAESIIDLTNAILLSPYRKKLFFFLNFAFFRHYENGGIPPLSENQYTQIFELINNFIKKTFDAEIDGIGDINEFVKIKDAFKYCSLDGYENNCTREIFEFANRPLMIKIFLWYLLQGASEALSKFE